MAPLGTSSLLLQLSGSLGLLPAKPETSLRGIAGGAGGSKRRGKSFFQSASRDDMFFYWGWLGGSTQPLEIWWDYDEDTPRKACKKDSFSFPSYDDNHINYFKGKDQVTARCDLVSWPLDRPPCYSSDSECSDKHGDWKTTRFCTVCRKRCCTLTGLHQLDRKQGDYIKKGSGTGSEEQPVKVNCPLADKQNKIALTPKECRLMWSS